MSTFSNEHENPSDEDVELSLKMEEGYILSKFVFLFLLKTTSSFFVPKTAMSGTH